LSDQRGNQDTKKVKKERLTSISPNAIIKTRNPSLKGESSMSKEKIVLFNGTDLSGWYARGTDLETPDWTIKEGIMTVKHRDIISKVQFGDAQIHLEFRTPYMPDCHGQARGNSGVYVHGCYEIQVLDSYGIENFNEGDCGGLYSIAKPLVNACLPPMEWQTYDIVLRAPRFNRYGEISENGRMTVILNGQVIHNNIELPRACPGGISTKRVRKAPLLLQDHGDKVYFRNIWVMPLE
jgi:hypothetical protein